jgi:hypothetical protein
MIVYIKEEKAGIKGNFTKAVSNFFLSLIIWTSLSALAAIAIDGFVKISRWETDLGAL